MYFLGIQGLNSCTLNLPSTIPHVNFIRCSFLIQDSDASIRKRALELVYLLVNESNVKPLTKELIDYLQVSGQDFKGDLTTKICSIVEK